MIKRLSVVAILVFVLAGCGLQKNKVSETPAINEKQIEDAHKIFSVVLDSMSNEQQEGVATIQEIDGTLKVMIAARSLGKSQAVGIYKGECSKTGELIHSLNSLVNGSSETMLDTNIASLSKDEPLVMGINTSGKNIFSSCGVIKVN